MWRRDFCFFLILLLSGKFYYLLGWEDHLKPTSPIEVIILKDLLEVSLILVSFRFWSSWKVLISWKIYLLLVTSCLSVCFWQFFHKPGFEVAQHYLRNVALHFFLLPWVLSRIQRGLSFNDTLWWFCQLNMFVGLAQLLLFPQTMLDEYRPLGLVGDPIILTFILCLFPFLLTKKDLDRKFTWISIVGILIVIDRASSLSALFSAGIATVGVLSIKGALREFYETIRAYFKPLLLTIGTLSVLVFAKSSYVLMKTLAILGFQTSRDLGKNSIRGRVKSYGELWDLKDFSLWEIFLGSTKDMYQRIDSLIASAFVNWGIIFLITYLLLFLLPIKLVYQKRVGGEGIYLYTAIIISFLALSLFNAVLYKFPINLIAIIAAGALYFQLSKNNGDFRPTS